MSAPELLVSSLLSVEPCSKTAMCARSSSGLGPWRSASVKEGREVRPRAARDDCCPSRVASMVKEGLRTWALSPSSFQYMIKGSASS